MGIQPSQQTQGMKGDDGRQQQGRGFISCHEIARQAEGAKKYYQ